MSGSIALYNPRIERRLGTIRLRNVTRSYQRIGIIMITAATLWLLILSGFPETEGLAGLLGKPWQDTNARYQPDSQTRPAESARSELLEKQDVVTGAILETVVIADNGPVHDVPVWGAVQTETGAVTSHDRILFYSLSLNRSYTTFSNPNGYFYIAAMTPAEDYSLWVTPAGNFRRYVRKNLVISAVQTEVSVVLEELPMGSLSANLVNSDGIAVAGFGLKVRSSEKDQWVATVITDASGRFQIDEVPLGALEFSSTYGPALRITGYEFKGDQPPLNLVVDQGQYAINGLVVDQYNLPVGGASAVLNWENTTGGMRSVVNRHIITNPSGQFSIKDIGSGNHDLIITDTHDSINRQTIDIFSLSTDLTVVLSPTP